MVRLTRAGPSSTELGIFLYKNLRGSRRCPPWIQEDSRLQYGVRETLCSAECLHFNESGLPKDVEMVNVTPSYLDPDASPASAGARLRRD